MEGEGEEKKARNYVRIINVGFLKKKSPITPVKARKQITELEQEPSITSLLTPAQLELKADATTIKWVSLYLAFPCAATDAIAFFTVSSSPRNLMDTTGLSPC